jgi:cytochrome c oxidase subunit 2
MFNNWFPEQISQVAKQIDDLFWYTSAYTLGAAILVFVILGFFVVRYYRKFHPRPYYTHGTSRGALLLTAVLAVTVFLALDVNFAYQDHKVWMAMFGNPPALKDSLPIEIMPEQFAWNIRYAGPDGLFATTDDVVTINELHVPAGKPVHVQLTSKDVIHSFFLPNLRIKQDAIPGMITAIYFLAERVGQYNIACAQHCGLGHYRMKGEFVVDAPSDFDAWLKQKAGEQGEPTTWGWSWKKAKENS